MPAMETLRTAARGATSTATPTSPAMRCMACSTPWMTPTSYAGTASSTARVVPT